jgi:hypothetical protein
MMAADRCEQLARALQGMSDAIANEDVQNAGEEIARCASNVYTVSACIGRRMEEMHEHVQAIHGPLQGRTLLFDADVERANALPADYETDLESEWSNPSECDCECCG